MTKFLGHGSNKIYKRCKDLSILIKNAILKYTY